MSFVHECRFRWWALRQLAYELRLAEDRSDAWMAIEDELWRSVILGHVNMSDLWALEDDFPELRLPTFVSMRRLMEIVDARFDDAVADGLERWGSHPGYLRVQQAHIHACEECRDRVYDEVRESIRQRMELEPLFRQLRRGNADG